MPYDIVERSSGFWVILTSGHAEGPYPSRVEAEKGAAFLSRFSAASSGIDDTDTDE